MRDKIKVTSQPVSKELTVDELQTWVMNHLGIPACSLIRGSTPGLGELAHADSFIESVLNGMVQDGAICNYTRACYYVLYSVPTITGHLFLNNNKASIRFLINRNSVDIAILP